MRAVWHVLRLRGVWVWGLFALVLLLAPRLFGSGLGVTLLAQMGIAVIACLSYNVLLGQGGLLSFGHAVYTGLGAYAAIHALAWVNQGGGPLPVSLLPLVGGLAGLFWAALLGWVCTRRGGTTFGMITLGLGELVFALSFMLDDFFGGEAGVTADRVTGPPVWGISFGPLLQVYYLIAAYTLVCVALLYAFTRTPLGRLLNATRDNAERVAFIGFDPHWVRYLAFLVAGFFAGVAGGLSAVLFEIVTAEAVGAMRSGAYLLFTFLGGTALFAGPIIGGVLMVLATVLLSELTRAWLLYLGLAFMLMVRWAPGGLAGLALAHGRVLGQGAWRRLWPHYLALALALAPLLLGASALIELLYQRQLEINPDGHLRWLGLGLSAHATASWLGMAALAAVGAALTAWAGRRFARAWALETRHAPVGPA